MNAIEDNAWRRGWQSAGQALLLRSAKPQLIFCVSAHWLTQGGWQLTGMAWPKTIHDFGGFPKALYDEAYPVPGAPVVARQLAHELRSPAGGGTLGVDTQQWGLDHGAWSVLKPMFPKADIPVLQLSMDYSRPPAEHYTLGQQLRRWRERGVLIVGSGNIVHNLRMVDFSLAGQGFDWAHRYDDAARDLLTSDPGSIAKLLEHPDHRRAVPTPDHFLPVAYLAGLAAASGEALDVLVDGYDAGSLSMTSYVLRAA